MTIAITDADKSYVVHTINKYTPKVRKELQKKLSRYTGKDVEKDAALDASYEVFFDLIEKVELINNVDNSVTNVDKSVIEEFDMGNFTEVVKGVMDVVRFDKTMYTMFGVGFGVIEPSEADLKKAASQ
jgi:hypothetical protein